MADAGLTGNGEACPACAMRRARMDLSATLRPAVPCNNCGGTGRIGWSDERIIADAVAWAKKHYWPEFYRRNGMETK